jgi:hypothetical protein
MLEQLNSPNGTQESENPLAESISRKDVWLAWLAGVIEGEGCISVKWGLQTNQKHYGDNRIRTIVNIYNTNPYLIKKIGEVLVENEIPFCQCGSTRSNGERPGVAVIVDGKQRVKKLLNLVLPYLVGKRRQAELTLELIDYRESLAIKGRESKGRFGNLKLRDDFKIQSLIDEIANEKRNYPSVLTFSRQANIPLGESPTTTRFPQAA